MSLYEILMVLIGFGSLIIAFVTLIITLINKINKINRK